MKTEDRVHGDTGTDLTTEQVNEVTKKKRGAKWIHDLSEDGPSGLEPGDNSKFVRHALASWNLPPIDISDPEQVSNRLGEYFRYCMDNDRKPQVVGMCNWLGISRNTLNTWKNGEYRNGTHSDVIRKAYDLLEEIWIDYMQNGKINPATGIFLAKNFWNYKDVADVVVTPNQPYQGASEEDLKQKYLEDMAEDGE